MGHLFVVQADLTKLAVDRLIIPTDDRANVHEGFLWAIDAPTRPATYRSLSPAYRHVVIHGGTAGLGPWRTTPTEGGPQPWLFDATPIRGSSVNHETWSEAEGTDRIVDSLMSRLTHAVERVASDPLPEGRRPRIALPLMGLRAGGFAKYYDRVVLRTLETLATACAGTNGPDIILVLRSRADYAAVQHLRRTHPVGAALGADPDWTEALAHARQLAERATRGKLVLFLGSGASAGAGLPDWWGLLNGLADSVGLHLDLATLQMDPRDAAHLIGSAHPGGPEAIREEIAKSFDLDRYSLTHALLASLRVDQALTTNYDTLYETAFRDAAKSDERQIRVLPREPYVAGRPWVMKIHGDAKDPKSIVLSRDDYLDFDARSVPMASVLQSAMVTSHLLFVGYSMRDENVVRLARQVIRFREQHRDPGEVHASESVGTVLTRKVDEVKQTLWQGVLDYVAPPELRAASGDTLTDPDDRNLLIFLDVLGMYACQDAGYFMVERYKGLLSDADKAMLQPLRDLQSSVAAAGAASAAAPGVRALLTSFGAES